ncbi:zinc-binding alcohol dehydrogenase family protein [Aspergillus vadensis CBS 113365]|uniref:GroES-like protein n=1 Tax=Aspergillus vadensis (strain CBS 113365 / IMI 142717 / IBT 24658) TaxID=1448311 RepID=A0A319BK69_ASPVC|nr:GroES-like protein [Aspergillus vadensis CBS 113365]PYH72664.1 GroES-like protein [Aspergillus vadensis CBS 113365]
MKPQQNTALYVNENVGFEIRREQGIPVPSDGELLIETLYSGANPADVKHATLLGIYPSVLGYDFCGKVIKTPPGSNLRLGEVVAGYTPTGIGRPAKYGAHQQYLACPDEMAFSVPINLPQHHAACLSVVVMTACDALYNIFKFPLPSNLQGAKESQPHQQPQPLLIWGASSGVGLSAVQLARASGIHPILVTASPKNHPLLLRLGATCCFDYKSPNVVSEIAASLEDGQWGKLRRGFDAVGSQTDPSSAELLARCVAADDAQLVSVVVQRDPRFRMPFATTNSDVTIRVTGTPGPITIPARRDDYKRAWGVFQWAVEHYGKHFELPEVDVFSGSAEEALERLQVLGGAGQGMGKLAIQHPLR